MLSLSKFLEVFLENENPLSPNFKIKYLEIIFNLSVKV